MESESDKQLKDERDECNRIAQLVRDYMKDVENDNPLTMFGNFARLVQNIHKHSNEHTSSFSDIIWLNAVPELVEILLVWCAQTLGQKYNISGIELATLSKVIVSKIESQRFPSHESITILSPTDMLFPENDPLFSKVLDNKAAENLVSLAKAILESNDKITEHQLVRVTEISKGLLPCGFNSEDAVRYRTIDNLERLKPNYIEPELTEKEKEYLLQVHESAIADLEASSDFDSREDNLIP